MKATVKQKIGPFESKDQFDSWCSVMKTLPEFGFKYAFYDFKKNSGYGFFYISVVGGTTKGQTMVESSE